LLDSDSIHHGFQLDIRHNRGLACNEDNTRYLSETLQGYHQKHQWFEAQKDFVATTINVQQKIVHETVGKQCPVEQTCHKSNTRHWIHIHTPRKRRDDHSILCWLTFDIIENVFVCHLCVSNSYSGSLYSNLSQFNQNYVLFWEGFHRLVCSPIELWQTTVSHIDADHWSLC